MDKIIVENKYKLKELIGSGKFGNVFLAINIFSNENVAIKMEKISEINTLKHEAKLYEYLNKNNFKNLSLLKSYGIIENYNYLLEYYNENINNYNNLDSEDSKKLFFCKIIKILENLHNLKIIHRI